MDSEFLKDKKHIDLTSYFTAKGIDKKALDIDEYGKIIYDEKEYYLRPIRKNINTLYCELIAEKLLDKLNLPHVNYYLADFFGEVRLMSNSFKKENKNYISGETILENYIDFRKLHNDASDLNNLEMIWLALSHRYSKIYNKINANQIIAKLMNQLTTLFSFDIVVDNDDRSCNNWIIEESKDNISLSMIFDNEYMLNSYLDDGSLNSFALGVYPEDTEHFTYYIDIIKKYIRDSSSEFIDKLITVYNTLSIDVFIQCIKEVEEKFQFIIPSENKELIINSYKKHYELLGQILAEYKLHPSRLI